MDKRPIARLVAKPAKEGGGPPAEHKEFDKPHPTHLGHPAVREEDEIIRTTEEARQTYPFLGELISELEAVNAEVERMRAEKSHSVDDDTSQLTALGDDNTGDRLRKAAENRKKLRGLDVIIKDYLGGEEPIVIESTGEEVEREEDTLIMNADGRDPRTAVLQDYHEEHERKSGRIEVPAERRAHIQQLVERVKKMSPERRKERFSQLPLNTRQQVLAVLVEESRQKKAKPIQLKVTLGQKPFFQIKPVEKV